MACLSAFRDVLTASFLSPSCLPQLSVQATTHSGTSAACCCCECVPHVAVCAGDNPLGNRRGLLLLRGTLGYGSITCFFLACQLLPLADATTFTFLAPLLVAVLSPLVLQERPSAATAIVIPLCICGVLLITQPAFLFGDGTVKLPWLGILFGLGQPFFSATAKVRLFRGPVREPCVCFFASSVCLLCEGVPALVVPAAR